MVNFLGMPTRQPIKNGQLLKKQLEQTKTKLINKNYNEIYQHEAAHKSAAGSYGGSIHIQNNSAGIPVSGFVPIAMPSTPKKGDKKSIANTIEHAKTVIKAAMAPNKPSQADFNVKASAEKTLNKANSMKNDISSKKLDYNA